MAQVLYVTSDRDGTGKTAVCAALARTLADAGKSAAVFKPFASGGDRPDTDADSYRTLLNETAGNWPVGLPTEGLSDSLVKQVVSMADEASDGADVLIAEGSTDLSHDDSTKLVEALDAVVLAVIGYRRDLSADDLAIWSERHGDGLVGFVVNGLTRYVGTEFAEGLLSEAESRGLLVLGVVPEDRRLLGVTVAQLADHLDGDFVVDGNGPSGLVEHLMVGGLGMDPGEFHFGLRENKAVIVRGDRPDIQMAALGTSTACMVLTKGIAPIEYVKYEAEQEEVPVMVVSTDTLTTMDAVAGLIDGARFDHPLKLEMYRDLLKQHVDLTALFGRLGLAVKSLPPEREG